MTSTRKNTHILKKEIKKATEDGKLSHAPWIGKINIVKTAILPKAIYMFNAIPIKIPMTFIIEIEKSALKFIWKHKRLPISKAILSRKSNAGESNCTSNSTIVIAIKQAWYWHKNRYEDQWNKIEDPDVNSHNFTH
jgi:hypothetical protein